MSDVTLPRVVRSEWIKLGSLRSTVAGYVVIAASTVVVAAIYLTLPGADAATANAAFTGLLLAELMVGITGVLAGSGEYSARTSRTTFTAVPRRVPVLAAKVLVHAGLVTALMLVGTIVAIIADPVLASHTAGSVTDGVVLRALTGTAMTLVGACVLGIALGTLTRSAAAGIGILFAMLLLPVIVVTAPGATAYLPGRAVQAVVLSDNAASLRLLSPGVAVVVFAAWVLAGLCAAAIALRKRDV
jgi:ABC-2 type transport system permease protein